MGAPIYLLLFGAGGGGGIFLYSQKSISKNYKVPKSNQVLSKILAKNNKDV
jgi:hypothetical protein